MNHSQECTHIPKRSVKICNRNLCTGNTVAEPAHVNNARTLKGT